MYSAAAGRRVRSGYDDGDGITRADKDCLDYYGGSYGEDRRDQGGRHRRESRASPTAAIWNRRTTTRRPFRSQSEVGGQPQWRSSGGTCSEGIWDDWSDYRSEPTNRRQRTSSSDNCYNSRYGSVGAATVHQRFERDTPERTASRVRFCDGISAGSFRLQPLPNSQFLPLPSRYVRKIPPPAPVHLPIARPRLVKTDMQERTYEMISNAASACVARHSADVDVSRAVKLRVENRLGGCWMVVVGDNFATFLTEDAFRAGTFAYFFVGRQAFLIFKCF